MGNNPREITNSLRVYYKDPRTLEPSPIRFQTTGNLPISDVKAWRADCRTGDPTFGNTGKRVGRYTQEINTGDPTFGNTEMR